MVRSRVVVFPTSWWVAGVAFGSLWASGTGSGGFRSVGGQGDVWAEVSKPAADPGRCQPTRPDRFLPGSAQVGGERAGETQLGVGGDDQPRPPVGCLRSADLRDGPAQGLFEQPEGVFEIETAQER